jgi:hypothetical protein
MFAVTVAAIFALLLQSGVCAETDFRGADGRTLSVIVCPHLSTPDTGDGAPSSGGDAPDTPSTSPDQHT